MIWRYLLLALAMHLCVSCGNKDAAQINAKVPISATEAQLDTLQNDPAKRAWVIERANYFLQVLKSAGVRLPEATCKAEEIRWLRVYPGDLKGEFDWWIETTQVSVSLTDQGDLTNLHFPSESEAHRKYFDHFRRMESDPDYGLFLQNADQLSTESMRASNELVLKALKPNDWQNYRLWRETIDRNKWSVGRGYSSGQFAGSYFFDGLVYGLPCDGNHVAISYDRITGMLQSYSALDIENEFPHPRAIELTELDAKEMARGMLLKYRSPAADTVVSCSLLKMTFARIGGPLGTGEWDMNKPRIAYRVRVHWRPPSASGWYTDDVTLDAISGELLDIAHYMMISRGDSPPVPREQCADMH